MQASEWGTSFDRSKFGDVPDAEKILDTYERRDFERKRELVRAADEVAKPAMQLARIDTKTAAIEKSVRRIEDIGEDQLSLRATIYDMQQMMIAQGKKLDDQSQKLSYQSEKIQEQNEKLKEQDELRKKDKEEHAQEMEELRKAGNAAVENSNKEIGNLNEQVKKLDRENIILKSENQIRDDKVNKLSSRLDAKEKGKDLGKLIGFSILAVGTLGLVSAPLICTSINVSKTRSLSESQGISYCDAKAMI